jgi:CheY-like chemotaxis protein
VVCHDACRAAAVRRAAAFRPSGASSSSRPLPRPNRRADDEALVRAGFMVLVDSVPGLTVVGEAGNGVKAVRHARALKPDVVQMDIRMPVIDELEATKLILDGDQDPPPRILVVTTFDEDEHVFDALRSCSPPPSPAG